MKKSGFSKFKNRKENPLCLDDDGNVVEQQQPKMVRRSKDTQMKDVEDVRKGMDFWYFSLYIMLDIVRLL